MEEIRNSKWGGGHLLQTRIVHGGQDFYVLLIEIEGRAVSVSVLNRK